MPTARPSAQFFWFFYIYTHLFICIKYFNIFIYCCQVFILIVGWWGVSTC
jgi:hypothetical protein